MHQDLSRRHDRVGTLFPAARSPEERQSFVLRDEQIATFERDGFVAGVPVLDDAQVEALREELDAIMDPGHPGNQLFYEFHANESSAPGTVLFHALGAWRILPGLHDVLWHPAITVPASQLLGGAVRFWHDQIFSKPPRHGGVVAWHQDYSYWTRTRPLNHLTCWIGLDDADEDNGCVLYIPGSHRWSLLPVTGLAGDMDAIQSVLSEEQRAAFQPVPARLRRGEATFHHGLTVHGSRENRTDRPRRALVVNMFLDGTLSDSDEPLLTGVPAVEKGSAMGGRFFPLLLDPDRPEDSGQALEDPGQALGER